MPHPEWYVFPFGKPSPSDPTRPVTTLKTAWNNVRKNAKVKGRWHDNRHTLITDLAESGAGDQTIMDIAGHVSKQMLKHYSHIRMEAKRTALESIVKKPAGKDASIQQNGQAAGTQQEVLDRSQNGTPRPAISDSTAQPANSFSAKKTEQHYSELPMNTQHSDGESLQKSLQSCSFEVDGGVKKRCKSLNLNGGRGRNRTYNLSVKRGKRTICMKLHSVA
jgi:hypothetical protein